MMDKKTSTANAEAEREPAPAGSTFLSPEEMTSEGEVVFRDGQLPRRKPKASVDPERVKNANGCPCDHDAQRNDGWKYCRICQKRLKWAESG